MVPDDLRYTREHEWVRQADPADGGSPIVRVGITDHAQDALGDIVFVQLPAVGSTVNAGAVMGEVESTKSVSDVYAPLTGSVVAVNATLDAAPELINTDPYGDGWMFEIELSDPAELGRLIDSATYTAHIDGP
jgi:glycine cleavage system H protein